MKKVLILGAAGRDFHNFNVVFRDHPEFRVVGFTATQIPGIANRRYPPELAGPAYPEGIPIFEEKELERLIADHGVDAVVFSYSDISHLNLMHLASRAVAAGADFWLLATRRTQLEIMCPGNLDLRRANRMRKKPGGSPRGVRSTRQRAHARGGSPPDALWGLGRAGGATVRDDAGPRFAAVHNRRTRGI